MNIVEVMEVIAGHAHYNASLDEMIRSQPLPIIEAFTNNQAHLLKECLTSQKRQPDKDTVFSINN